MIREIVKENYDGEKYYLELACAESDTVYFYNPDIGELYSIKYDGSGKTQLNPSGKFFWYECVSGNELFGSSDDEPALFNIETGSVIKLSENK